MITVFKPSSIGFQSLTLMYISKQDSEDKAMCQFIFTSLKKVMCPLAFDGIVGL